MVLTVLVSIEVEPVHITVAWLSGFSDQRRTIQCENELLLGETLMT